MQMESRSWSQLYSEPNWIGMFLIALAILSVILVFIFSIPILRSLGLRSSSIKKLVRTKTRSMDGLSKSELAEFACGVGKHWLEGGLVTLASEPGKPNSAADDRLFHLAENIFDYRYSQIERYLGLIRWVAYLLAGICFFVLLGETQEMFGGMSTSKQMPFWAILSSVAELLGQLNWPILTILMILIWERTLTIRLWSRRATWKYLVS